MKNMDTSQIDAETQSLRGSTLKKMIYFVNVERHSINKENKDINIEDHVRKLMLQRFNLLEK